MALKKVDEHTIRGKQLQRDWNASNTAQHSHVLQ